MPRTRSRTYTDDALNHVAFPLGGMGAGMIALEGTGGFSQVSLFHSPDIANAPMMFAALHVNGVSTPRVLEGPVPLCKAFGGPNAGKGGRLKNFGLPRFAKATFAAQFPFGKVTLADPSMPIRAEITGWSPFIPNDSDNSSLPVAGVEYRLTNTTRKPVKGVFSFHSRNFMGHKPCAAGDRIEAIPGGFLLSGRGAGDETSGAFAAFTDAPGAKTDCAWWLLKWGIEVTTALWRTIAGGKVLSRPPPGEGTVGEGASLYVPYALKGRESKTVRVLLAWYVPTSTLRIGDDAGPSTYSPWYASRFGSAEEVIAHWRTHYDTLRTESLRFSRCFTDTTLPAEAVEAAAANLAILKSPTVLRQHDGRLWGWEGSGDDEGCCHGSCTHVWNYAQSLCHLFPALERTLRETEFSVCQDERGHQVFRAPLPIHPPTGEVTKFHAAADGQLGGMMKMYRDWRISGDTDWMKRLWPKVRQSMDYCIRQWDPDHTGTLVEPHHNTYDVEFWGADSMCTSIYLGALQAAIAMGETCGDDVAAYRELLAQGKRAMETALWNGEYFFQHVQWTNLRAPLRAESPDTPPEILAMLRQEGPRYQYGSGCLSDGAIGDWMARVCGLGPVLDAKKTDRHLSSVYCHNFHPSLADRANGHRTGFAFGREGGLVLCSWPRGAKLTQPFYFSDEVWTGVEYQVAAHSIMVGRVKEGLAIVRTVRARYDGRVRNPFDEYECGHWYARAMSSYSLLQALSGARYDAVDKTLYLEGKIKGDFRAFLCTASGYGTVGMKQGKPFLTVKAGKIPVNAIEVTHGNSVKKW